VCYKIERFTVVFSVVDPGGALRAGLWSLSRQRSGGSVCAAAKAELVHGRCGLLTRKRQAGCSVNLIFLTRVYLFLELKK